MKTESQITAFLMELSERVTDAVGCGCCAKGEDTETIMDFVYKFAMTIETKEYPQSERDLFS